MMTKLSLPDDGFGDWIKAGEDYIIIQILALPRASKSEISGLHDGRLKVRLKAPPVDGAANKELIRFLSKLLKVPKSGFTLLKGHANRRKVMQINGIIPQKAARILKL